MLHKVSTFLADTVVVFFILWEFMIVSKLGLKLLVELEKLQGSILVVAIVITNVIFSLTCSRRVHEPPRQHHRTLPVTRLVVLWFLLRVGGLVLSG